MKLTNLLSYFRKRTASNNLIVSANKVGLCAKEH